MMIYRVTVCETVSIQKNPKDIASNAIDGDGLISLFVSNYVSISECDTVWYANQYPVVCGAMYHGMDSGVHMPRSAERYSLKS
jgi:hypothetical protein